MQVFNPSNKTFLQLAPLPFAQGGEGALYQITKGAEPSKWVAKIYHVNKRTHARADRLRYLIQHPPALKTTGAQMLSWPVAILEQAGEFVGCLLPKVAGEPLEILATLRLPRRLAKTWQRFDWSSPQAFGLRQKVCFNIAVALYHLHKTQRYVVIDFKPDNILIQENGWIALVDMDSVGVVEEGRLLFPAAMATPEYAPPEFDLSNGSNQQHQLSQDWDAFSLAVIFYKVLLGVHPFAATAMGDFEQFTSLGDKINHGLYVHDPAHQKDFAYIPQPHQDFHQLPKNLQILFNQCFITGIQQPEKRPSAEAWCFALEGKRSAVSSLKNYTLPAALQQFEVQFPAMLGAASVRFYEKADAVHFLADQLPVVREQMKQERYKQYQKGILGGLGTVILAGIFIWQQSELGLLLSLFIGVFGYEWYKEAALLDLKPAPSWPTALAALSKIERKQLWQWWQERTATIRKAYQVYKNNYQSLKKQFQLAQQTWEEAQHEAELLCRQLTIQQAQALFENEQERNQQAVWRLLKGKNRQQKQQFLEQQYAQEQAAKLQKEYEERLLAIDAKYQERWQALEENHYKRLDHIELKIPKTQRAAAKADEEQTFVVQRQAIVAAINSDKVAAKAQYKAKEAKEQIKQQHYQTQLKVVDEAQQTKAQTISQTYQDRYQNCIEGLQRAQERYQRKHQQLISVHQKVRKSYQNKLALCWAAIGLNAQGLLAEQQDQK